MFKWFLYSNNGDVGSTVEIKAENLVEAITVMQKEWKSLHPHDQKALCELGVYYAPIDDDGNPMYEQSATESWLVLNGEMRLAYNVMVTHYKNIGVGVMEPRYEIARVDCSKGKSDHFFDVLDYNDSLPQPYENLDDWYIEITISFYAEDADFTKNSPLMEVTDTIL